MWTAENEFARQGDFGPIGDINRYRANRATIVDR